MPRPCAWDDQVEQGDVLLLSIRLVVEVSPTTTRCLAGCIFNHPA
jgi:hypothetical protein